MDCFCVGEPWNEQLKNQKIGYTAINTGELWNKHPEKSFAMRADWVDRHPQATRAILMAILEAQMWCDIPANRGELAKIVSGRQWFNCPVADIAPRLAGRFDYGTGRVVEDSPHIMKFWKDAASYPYRSHELWFLVEGVRWGKLTAKEDLKGLVAKVNREDLWRDAAKALNVPAAQIPASPSRGIERFFDGKVFDPERPEAYLASLAIKRAG
jgi:nitrate/nitrite transport system substrate-binding protein